MSRLIILLPALCIAFNTFLSSGWTGRNIFTGINTPVLSSVAGLSVACLTATTAVSRIIGESNPLTAQFNQRNDRADKEPLAFQTCIAPTHLKSFSSTVQPHFPWFNELFVARDNAYRTHAPPGMNSFFLLFLLSFLVVLSRSNLPWERYGVLENTSTRLVMNSRVFLLSGRVPL
jgi:hypothetical protein